MEICSLYHAKFDQLISSLASDLCREGIEDAEKAKEKIKKKFGICKPDDVAKVCNVHTR